MCPWQTQTALGQYGTVLKMTCPPKADGLHETEVSDRMGRETRDEGSMRRDWCSGHGDCARIVHSRSFTGIECRVELALNQSAARIAFGTSFGGAGKQGTGTWTLPQLPLSILKKVESLDYVGGAAEKDGRREARILVGNKVLCTNRAASFSSFPIDPISVAHCRVISPP